nr:hypothetical protein [uncultured bacterium]
MYDKNTIVLKIRLIFTYTCYVYCIRKNAKNFNRFYFSNTLLCFLIYVSFCGVFAEISINYLCLWLLKEILIVV